MIPTLGHSHLRYCFFLSGMRSFLLDTSHWGTPSLVGGWFLDDHHAEAHSSQSILDVFESWLSLGGDQTFFFHIGAWDMIDIFHPVYFTQGHTSFDRWWFLGIDVPWRCLDSFHIGVPDMTGWFLWCDYRSVAFSSLLTDFSDDWIRT